MKPKVELDLASTLNFLLGDTKVTDEVNKKIDDTKAKLWKKPVSKRMQLKVAQAKVSDTRTSTTGAGKR